MRKGLVSAFLILLTSIEGFSQYDSLCCEPSVQKKEANLIFFYQNFISNYDTVDALNKVNQIRKVASEKKDKEFLLEADFLEAYYYANRMPLQTEKVLLKLRAVQKRAETAGYVRILMRTLSTLGIYYGNHLKDYENHFEAYEYLKNLLDKHKEDETLDKLPYYIEIAHAYYRFREYEHTIELLKDIAYTESNRSTSYGVWQANNTIALCFRMLNQMDSSTYYFERAKRSALDMYKDSLRYAIAIGNIGMNKFLQKKYSEAKPLIRIDINSSVAYKEYSSAAASLLVYTDILNFENNLDEAKRTLDSAYFFLQKTHSSTLLSRYYPVVARWHHRKGNWEQSLLYYDSAFKAQHQLDSSYNNLKHTLAIQKLNLAKYEADLLQSKSKLKDRNFFMALICLLGASGFLYYQYHRKLTRQKESNRDLQLNKTQRELEIAQLKLDEYTHNLGIKNKIIESLQEELNSDAKLTIIEDLKTSTLLTDDDWDKFKDVFEKVHIGFIARMNQKLPKLTTSEQRFLTLVKLQLSYREMALMLGVSPKSLRITHYRLRKKLDLAEIDDLQSLIDNI